MKETIRKDFIEKVRLAAAEGIVLLENKENALPLKEKERVSVFGRAQIDYYRSGTGSGGSIRVTYSVNFLEGLRKCETLCINEELVKHYEEWIKQHPFNNGGGGWAAEPWFQEDMELENEFVDRIAKDGGKAIYVIGRTAGEDKDNFEGEGSFCLTSVERKNLSVLCRNFDCVILILNVSNIIDMSFLDELPDKDHLKAILYAWQGGMEGGNGIADILIGKVTPSGKLPDTIARNYADYPSSSNYGGEEENFYQEDIYVGYRYFETFAPEKVRYEFGFGLSYTSFQITPLHLQWMNGRDEDKSNQVPLTTESYLSVVTEVTNTGDYAGKEVVQMYLEAPQGELGRPKRILLGFQKTELLQPGETARLECKLDVTDFATYDDSGATGNPYCYVLEAGTYHLYVGNSVRQVKEVLTEGEPVLTLKENIVVKKCEQAVAPVKAFQRLRPGKALSSSYGTIYEKEYEETPLSNVDIRNRIISRLPEELPITGDRGIRLKDVAEGKAELKEFIQQLSVSELQTIVRGEGMGHPDVTSGTAAAFGGVGDHLLEYGIPLACAADGPSGIRMEGGNYAVQLPIGTLLAASFNVELMEEIYTGTGLEMQEYKIDVLLGPGVNIHRDPLNGRNFEYYSEDPFLTGCMATACMRGLQKGGGQGTLKHLACNNQEKRRSFVDAIVSERAFREIYGKGFEMAVRSGYSAAVMTSYNPMNGHWTASNYDLCTTILRREWGFEGLVMTDWWAKMNDVEEGGEATVHKVRDMVRAQNDVYMVVNNYGAEINGNGDDLEEALEQGRLTIGELQRSAINICTFIMQSGVFLRGEKQEKAHITIPAEKQSTQTPDSVMEVSQNARIVIKAGQKTELEVMEDGDYILLAGLKSSDTNMVQTSCQLFMNGEKAGFVQTQGTMGNLITQKLNKLKLQKGFYIIEYQVIKPHIELEWIELRKL